jgi:hypothetical protein
VAAAAPDQDAGVVSLPPSWRAMSSNIASMLPPSSVT